MAAGRPREFDEEEVLEKAMQFFWLHGYHAVGLTELLAHMGIARQSLYDTFGNKRELFIRVIGHYRRTRLAEALALLERDGSPRENVKDVLRFFHRLAKDQRCRGCLVANTLVEMTPHDEEIGELLQETLGLLEKGVRRGLRLAQKRGELPPERSARQLSRALINAIIGIAVMGKLGLAEAAIDDIYKGTLCLLD